MSLHHGTHKIITVMLVIAALDLITQKLWLVMTYGALWSILLFRQSKRISRTSSMVSPVSGIVARVFRTNLSDKEVFCIRIDTRPILDCQTFRAISADTVSAVKFAPYSRTVIYKSGLTVKHVPTLDIAQMFLDPDNIDSLVETESNPVYGSSLLGCTTTIVLPVGYSTNLIEGQTVIDGETIIGGQQ